MTSTDTDSTGDSDTRSARERVSPRKGQIVITLIAVFFLFLLWQAFTYTGLISRIAEWQFSWLRYWLPTFTLIIFCTLATLLWMAIAGFVAWWRKRRLRKAGIWVPNDDEVRRLRRLGIATSGLLMTATLCALLVLGGLVHWLTLPGFDGKAHPWNVTGVPHEGRTSLAGAGAVGPVARYREAIFDIGPSQYFVPIARRGTDGELTLFAELTVVNGKPRLLTERDGVLRNGALPRELVYLYRYAGYPVLDEPAVIFRNPATSGRGTLVFMVEMLAAGLISLLFGLWLRRLHRKDQERLERKTQAALTDPA